MKIVAYWAVTIIVAFLFTTTGLGNIMHWPTIATGMAHLGYPSYFLTILGTWKLLGAIVILSPGFARIKEWAYAGMIFDTTGGAISRAAMGDGAGEIIIALVVAMLVATSWALRPASRTLAGAIA